MTYTLTDLGKSILEMPAKKKYLTIVSLILRHEIFYKTIEQYFERGARPTKMQVVEIMKTATLNFGSGTTISRRAQTVLAWVDWILSLSRTMYRDRILCGSQGVHMSITQPLSQV